MEKKNENKRIDVNAFVARDRNGELYFYTSKPTLREDGTFIGGGVVSDKQFMPFVGKLRACECVITVDIREK